MKKYDLFSSLTSKGIKNGTAGVFTVKELCNYIKDNRLSVPTYQRGFKWNEKQMAALFESMFTKKAPIAGIAVNKMTSEETAVPCISFLERETLNYGEIQGEKMCIVDGQHRAATLYMAFIDHPTVEEIVLNIKNGKFMKRNKSKSLQIPVGVLFNEKTAMYRSFLKSLKLNEKEMEILEEIITELREIFYSYTFSAVVATDLDEEEQNQWFIDLNKAGTVVNNNHLNISSILTDGYDVYKEFTVPFVERLSEAGYNVDAILTKDTKTSAPLSALKAPFEKKNKKVHSTSWSPLVSDDKLNTMVKEMKDKAQKTEAGISEIMEEYCKETLKNLDIALDLIKRNQLVLEDKRPFIKLPFILSSISWLNKLEENNEKILVEFYKKSNFVKGADHAPNRKLYSKLLLELGVDVSDEEEILKNKTWDAEKYK